MALLDRVKERSGSDLSDTELAAIILAIGVELDGALGPVGPVTREIGDPSDPHSRFFRTLLIAPPIDVSEDVTIVELDPGDSGDAAAEIELTAADYRVIHDGRTIQRLTSGPNGREYWAPLIRITYSPTGSAAAEAVRDEAIIKIAMIDLYYRGGMKSERAGDYQITLSGDPVGDRDAIINGLLPRGGFTLA